MIFYRRFWKPSAALLSRTLLVSLFLAVAGYACENLAPLPADAHLMQLPTQSHDCSAILPLSKTKVSFVRRNDSVNVLFIQKVLPSCGCTLAECDRTVVWPGEEYTVKATLSAPNHVADMSSHVTLLGRLGLSLVEGQCCLTGQVRDIIEMPQTDVAGFDLGSLPANELPVTIQRTITRGAYPLGFDRIVASSSSPWLKTSMYQVSQNQWLVSFRIESASVLGTSGYPVTFNFLRDSHELPESVTRQAYIDVAGQVYASPVSLLLPASSGQHVERIIEVKARDDNIQNDLRVTGVSSASKDITADWENSGEHPVVHLDYFAGPHVPDRGEITISACEHGHPYLVKVGFVTLAYGRRE